MLPDFRTQRDEMALDIGTTVSLAGSYIASNTSITLNGTFLLSQLILPDEPLVKYHYIMEGCYRDPSWPIVLQPLSWFWLFGLAPLFVFCLASLNGQGCKDWRRMLIMIIFGCSSFAANKVFNMWIYDRGDVVSAIGATVVGILGTIYGHYSEGDALPSMIPGILVLLPVSLKVLPCIVWMAHSLSFRLVSQWLEDSVPISMIQQPLWQAGWLLASGWFKVSSGNDLSPSHIGFLTTHMPLVTIGITVGLFASNLAVATFISAAHRIKGQPPRKSQVGSAF